MCGGAFQFLLIFITFIVSINAFAFNTDSDNQGEKKNSLKSYKQEYRRNKSK